MIVMIFKVNSLLSFADVNGASFYESKGCYLTTVVSNGECDDRNTNNKESDCWTEVQKDGSFSTFKAFCEYQLVTF